MSDRAIVFDLDGVLADSREPIIACVNAALEAIGLDMRSEAEVEQIIGPPSHIGFGELISEAPDSDVVAEMVAAYRTRYANALWDTRPFPGVPEAVRTLADQRSLAVATSKPRRHALPVLEAIGLADAFQVVAGPVPGGAADKQAMVAEALERLGGAAAMIGDRRYDMEAGRALGLRAIGVTWGYGSREELLAAGAQELVDIPPDLLQAVARACG